LAELDRWMWLGGSLLLALVTTNASWQAWRRRGGRARFGSFVRSGLFPPLRQLARLLYYIGLPFCALTLGHAAVGRSLGLQSLPSSPDLAAAWADWARDLSWAVGLGLAAWSVLAVGWLAVRRAGGGPEPIASHASTWVLLREAAFHEVHWSFYRNAPSVVLGLYWGAWAGLGLVALEAALNPWWRGDLGEASRAPAALVRAGLAALSATLCLQTENLWLAVLVHWGVTWGLVAWTRAFPLRDRQTPKAPDGYFQTCSK